MAMTGTDLPPAYYSLNEDEKTKKNATEVTIPESNDTPGIYGVMFEHKDNRIGFIQKVLVIKFFQILAVTLFMIIFVAPPYGLWMAMRYDLSVYINLIVVSLLALVVTVGLLHYCDKARFTTPYNYMLLVAYPLTFAFFISVVTWGWALNEIFVSCVHFNIVAFILLLYSVLSFQTAIEFKTSTGLIITGGVLIVAYSLTIPFFLYDVNPFGALYCSLMMFGLTAYVLTDLQAMMSKTYRTHITPSDFVKAALIMHIDYRYMIMKSYNKCKQRRLNRDAQTLNSA